MSERPLEERVRKLERLLRDVSIAAIVIGLCITAFIGYQSYIGIPKAVQASFEASSAKEIEASAAEYLEKIESFHDQSEEAFKSLDQIELLNSISQNRDDIEATASTIQHLESLVHGHYLYLQNNCSQPIRFALQYTSTFREVVENGYWDLNANSGSYLTVDDRRIILVESDILYYARTTSGPVKYWRGSEIVKINDEELSMKRGEVESEEFRHVFTLICD